MALEVYYPRDIRNALLAAEQASAATLAAAVAAPNGKENEFPTRVEIAAQNSDLMMATYLSALENRKVELPTELSNSLVKRICRLGK